jgi:hypothetical protein
MDMKEQRFGIEIEMTGLTRQAAAEVRWLASINIAKRLIRDSLKNSTERSPIRSMRLAASGTEAKIEDTITMTIAAIIVSTFTVCFKKAR